MGLPLVRLLSDLLEFMLELSATRSIKLAFVDLAVPPSFTKTPPDVADFILRRNVSLECRASGVPSPTVHWARSALPLPEGRSRQEEGVLNITEVQTEDSGNYTCTASNKLGVIKTTTTLRVGT